MSAQQLKFNRQQREALADIDRWLDDGRSQVYRLFGYAGTGKTTLARYIGAKRGLVKYAAYTGKAADVMRRRGCHDAQTIHSLIYLPANDRALLLMELMAEQEVERNPKRRARIAEEIRRVQKELGEPGFILNENSELADADLLIIDECSMVSDDVAADILSFGVPVLVLGDPAQLPPVKGEGYFTDAEPDFMLTKVHRHLKGSTIIELATGIRKGMRPAPQMLDEGCSYGLHIDEDEQFGGFDQVIVGTNRERWRRIAAMREHHGLRGVLPKPGDKVICLRNNRDLGVLNGQMFTVRKAKKVNGGEQFLLRLTDEDGEKRVIMAWPHGFRGLQAQKDFEPRAHFARECAFMTFGWAITCHKAQGSQWPSVLVVNESQVFRGDQGRWLYTAITRAERRVVVTPPGRRRIT